MINLDEDGNTSLDRWKGGVGTFVANGTWGSGTLVLQADFGNGTWVDVYEMTADEIQNFELCPCDMRLNLSGSTSPDLDVLVSRAYAKQGGN